MDLFKLSFRLIACLGLAYTSYKVYECFSSTPDPKGSLQAQKKKREAEKTAAGATAEGKQHIVWFKVDIDQSNGVYLILMETIQPDGQHTLVRAILSPTGDTLYWHEIPLKD